MYREENTWRQEFLKSSQFNIQFIESMSMKQHMENMVKDCHLLSNCSILQYMMWPGSTCYCMDLLAKKTHVKHTEHQRFSEPEDPEDLQMSVILKHCWGTLYFNVLYCRASHSTVIGQEYTTVATMKDGARNGPAGTIAGCQRGMLNCSWAVAKLRYAVVQITAFKAGQY